MLRMREEHARTYSAPGPAVSTTAGQIPPGIRDRQGAVATPGTPFLLSAGLGAVAVAAAALTFGVPGILTGPAAMNGSARGTALVMLLLGVPTLAAAMLLTARGSLRGPVIWLGTLGYFVYNAVMFAFATPYNRLFLGYLAMLSLSVWALVSLLCRARPEGLSTEQLPARSIAAYIWVMVALNTGLWLSTIVPSLFADRPAVVTDGTGLATNPVFVQDLAIFLPAAAVAGVWLWQRRDWGVLLSGAVLTYWVLESVTVGVDQWFGAKADPSSGVVSMSAVPVFVVLTVVGLVPLWVHLRSIRSSPGG
jgi:hypothetical protein